MADRTERTQEATPRKQEKLRDEGKIARSIEVGAAAAILAMGLALAATGSTIARTVYTVTTRAMRLQDVGNPTYALASLVPALGSTLLPALLATAVVTAAVGLAQTRGLFNLSLVMPKLERLSPASHLPRLLPGKDSALELGKSLLKLVILGIVVYRIVAAAAPRFALLAAVEPTVAAAEVGSVATKVAVHGAIAFALIAVVDYVLARRRFLEEAKMSHQEVKDEHKEEQGDPTVRRRIRARMREAARRRAVSDVRKATVLVANPTHISIALRYETDRDAAPVILAKGIDDVATQMRSAARKHRVPIVENRPLARALHAHGKLGQYIPVELYRAAAEVIAHVMRLRAGAYV
ncbi:MAG: EscU/YscU/HrcU family type III secretion system export apparatus switch protein [Deltaproteobacteria bacterium]|nr:EscU/YscU/HrcU family type III secretion system export apparatus switch protein [Deltaproteobacteria bacterium]